MNVTSLLSPDPRILQVEKRQHRKNLLAIVLTIGILAGLGVIIERVCAMADELDRMEQLLNKATIHENVSPN